jgi:hypothetical protein
MIRKLLTLLRLLGIHLLHPNNVTRSATAKPHQAQPLASNFAANDSPVSILFQASSRP